MKRNIYACNLLNLCVIALVFGATHLNAQDGKWKTQLLEKDTQIIKQQYHYKSGKDSLADGPYTISSWPKDSAALYQSFVHVQLETEIRRGQPTGIFTNERAQLKVSAGMAHVRHYHLSLPSNGVTTKASGQMVRGVPTGPWSVKSHHIAEGEQDTLLFEMRGELSKEGVQQKSVFYQHHSGKQLTGPLDEEGRPHGTWIFEGANKFHLVFDHGKPISLGKQSAANPLPTAEKYQAVNFDENLVWWLEKTSTHYSEPVEKAVLNAYQDVAEAFKLIGLQNAQLLQNSPLTFVEKPFFVWLPMYPFGKQETNQLDTFKNAFQSLKVAILELKNYSPFYINQYKDADLANHMAKLLLLEQEVNHCATYLEIFTNAAAVHINRDGYAHALLGQRDTVQTKAFEFKDQAAEVRLHSPAWQEAQGYLENIHLRLTSFKAAYDTEKQQIEKVLSALKIENDLQALENEMVDLSNQLKDALEKFSVLLYLPKQTEQYRAGFETAIQKALESYAEQGAGKAVENATATISCIEKLAQALEQAGEIEKNAALIYKAYHVSELNPVTWTHMEQTNYERIFNAYRDKLVPHFFDALESAAKSSCTDFLSSLAHIKTMQLHILKLEEDNPGKINRKLRAADNVSTVLQKINLQIN